MKNKKYAGFIKQLEQRRKAIGEERDKLRELIGEYEGLDECSLRAAEAIDEAISALSELA